MDHQPLNDIEVTDEMVAAARRLPETARLSDMDLWAIYSAMAGARLEDAVDVPSALVKLGADSLWMLVDRGEGAEFDRTDAESAAAYVIRAVFASALRGMSVGPPSTSQPHGSER